MKTIITLETDDMQWTPEIVAIIKEDLGRCVDQIAVADKNSIIRTLSMRKYGNYGINVESDVKDAGWSKDGAIMRARHRLEEAELDYENARAAGYADLHEYEERVSEMKEELKRVLIGRYEKTK